MMKCKKIVASFLLIAMLVAPLSAYADTVYSDEEVLARGKLYYSYLEQVFGNIVKENEGASEVTLTGAVGFCNTDYLQQSEFDAKAQQGKISGPTIYVEYRIGNEETAYYISDLLPVGSPTTVLAKSNYTDAVKEMADSKTGAEILGNGFVKIGGEYRLRIDLADYAAQGYPTTKTQVEAIRAAKAATITESPERYYANLEKLLMTRGSNTEINEVIVCVKGIYTDDELAAIDYTDTDKIQYWMDYYTINMNNQRLRVKKAYSVLGDLTVIGNAGEYNQMALIANGRDMGYTEIAPGMYRNAEGWTVFRVDLNDYAAKGYVY